jgi:hypothetical protein
MTANSETLALERPQQEQDEFLALIEKVALNPEIDAEKLKVIVGLKLQLEDRAAEKAFDAAMQEAQKEVLTLRWDKLNPEKNSRYVSYPKIDEMLKPVRERYGFSESFGVEPELPAPTLMMMYSDVTYKGPEGTHRRRFHLPMSISGEGPKGGGVMTAAQAVGNGCSLGMRYLEKLIWKIPMLVDKDDNDGNAIRATISESQAKVLSDLFDRLSEPKRLEVLAYWTTTYKQEIKSVDDVPSFRFKHAETTLARALNSEGQNQPSPKTTINDIQVVTLQESIESNGKNCKADFLRHYGIKKIGELPSEKYTEALKWVENYRRK